MEEERYDALREIYRRLKDSDITWSISGSTGLTLRGVDVNPKDIDIIVDAEDVFEVEKKLSEFLVEGVEYSESEKFRSYFGRFEIESIEVEIMGDLEKKVDGRWQGPVDVEECTGEIEVRDMTLPVFKLEAEAKAYKELGRDKRAEKIKRKLEDS